MARKQGGVEGNTRSRAVLAQPSPARQLKRSAACLACPCSVWFNFLGRDFFNALAEKDVQLFQVQLVKYLTGFVVGIPVFVFAYYYQVMTCGQTLQWSCTNHSITIAVAKAHASMHACMHWARGWWGWVAGED